ncbi:MAG TPA: hypothetical protein VGC13_25115 [Longimicrobium sp.]|jgi:hypothetical protein|uniref:hypothetical protein n=1 Tax=Longimicrobium sp. TaxID=2029185 RepID=UPI002ED912BA
MIQPSRSLTKYLFVRMGWAFTVTSAILCGVGRAAAQEWPTPYNTPSTLGYHLEEAFSKVLTDCGLPGALYHKKVKEKNRRSGIPTAVRSYFREALLQPVDHQTNYGAARLLAYVFDSPTAAYAFQMTDPARAVGTPPSQDPITMFVPGASSLTHTQNCSSILAATTQAEAKLTVPAAHFSTAGAAMAQRQNRTLLSVTQGILQSPVYYGLQDPAASPSDKLQAQILAWRWYQAHADEATRTNYYVASFRGGTIYNASNASNAYSGQFNLRAGAAAPGIASAEASIRAEAALDAQTVINNVGTFHYRDAMGRPDLTIVTFPSPATIVGGIRIVPQLTMKSTTVSELAPHVHVAEVPGVPATACDFNLWTARRVDAGQLGLLELKKATPSTTTQGQPACQFEVALTLNAPPPPAAQISLRYDLVLGDPVGGSTFAIRAAENAILTSDAGPQLSHVVGTTTPATEAGSLVWTVRYQLTDPAGLINVGVQPQFLSWQLVCGGAPQTLNRTARWTANKEIEIRLEQPNAASYDPALPMLDCTMSGQVQMSLVSAPGTLRRTLEPAPIKHPQMPAAPPPTPVAATTNNGI